MIQCLCISVCLILAILCYVFLRDSSTWYLRYAWVVFAIGVVAEAAETLFFQKNIVASREPRAANAPKAIPYAKSVDDDDENLDGP